MPCLKGPAATQLQSILQCRNVDPVLADLLIFFPRAKPEVLIFFFFR